MDEHIEIREGPDHEVAINVGCDQRAFEGDDPDAAIVEGGEQTEQAARKEQVAPAGRARVVTQVLHDTSRNALGGGPLEVPMKEGPDAMSQGHLVQQGPIERLNCQLPYPRGGRAAQGGSGAIEEQFGLQVSLRPSMTLRRPLRVTWGHVCTLGVRRASRGPSQRPAGQDSSPRFHAPEESAGGEPWAISSLVR